MCNRGNAYGLLRVIPFGKRSLGRKGNRIVILRWIFGGYVVRVATRLNYLRIVSGRIVFMQLEKFCLSFVKVLECSVDMHLKYPIVRSRTQT
jgi:hypothetical protein